MRESSVSLPCLTATVCQMPSLASVRKCTLTPVSQKSIRCNVPQRMPDDRGNHLKLLSQHRPGWCAGRGAVELVVVECGSHIAATRADANGVVEHVDVGDVDLGARLSLDRDPVAGKDAVLQTNGAYAGYGTITKAVLDS